MIGQHCRFSHRGAGRQCQSQGADDRIAGTGHVIDLARLRGNMPGTPLPSNRLIPFRLASLAPLASQPLPNRFAGLLNRLIVVAMHSGGLSRFQMVGRDDRHTFVKAEMLDLRIDNNGNLPQSREPDNSAINAAVTTPFA